MTDPFRIRDHVPEFDAINRQFADASAAARARLRHDLDIAYGPDPRQRLDLFFPADLARPAPVHAFIHGGYWRAYGRQDFHFVAESITAAGAIAVVVDYRLMPGARMAQLVGDARGAAQWIGEEIAAHGGDPARFTASGHSAGAHLASYLAAMAPGETALPGPRPAALLLLSGLYDLAPLQRSFLQAEIGLTDEEVAQFSPLRADPVRAVRRDIVVGEAETPPFHQQAADYASRLTGAATETSVLPGANHMSLMLEFTEPQSSLGQRLAGLIRG